MSTGATVCHWSFRRPGDYGVLSVELVYTNVPKILHPEAFAMSDRRNLSGRLGVFAAIWFVLGATQAIADVQNLIQ